MIQHRLRVGTLRRGIEPSLMSGVFTQSLDVPRSHKGATARKARDHRRQLQGRRKDLRAILGQRADVEEIQGRHTLWSERREAQCNAGAVCMTHDSRRIDAKVREYD